MPTQERARPPPVQSPRNPLPQGSDELQKNLRRKTKMKNYQSLYYKNYFAQNADGDYIPVNRKDCFAPGETPTQDNPFRQRWFYDPEAGYAVRLERSQRGEDTYLMNTASLKKEERQRVKRSEMIELDRPRYDETGEEGYIELEDETADVSKIIEDAESLATLITAYGRVISLIHKYLNAGVMHNGVFEKTLVGVPQGGPLSPLLSNIMLNELDKELERRGHKFVRYADDCMIFCKSRKSANRTLKNIIPYIEGKLYLKVNKAKTETAHISKIKYLGYGFYRYRGICKMKVHKKSINKMKDKIRVLTRRSNGWSNEKRTEKINQFVHVYMEFHL